MAPIHHHFEQLGWSEPTVVIRFWIIAFVLALAGLSTLKLQMITSPAFAAKRYAVLGLARSGLATVEALVASGAEVTAWDKKEEAREEARSPAKAVSAGAKRRLDIARIPAPEIDRRFHRRPRRFDGVVVSPGVPLNTPSDRRRRARAGVPLIGDIELFAQARAELPPHKVVGITGTNGKSTTTALVHHILKTAGVPPRWAAISACRSWRRTRCPKAASMCSSCPATRST